MVALLKLFAVYYNINLNNRYVLFEMYSLLIFFFSFQLFSVAPLLNYKLNRWHKRALQSHIPPGDATPTPPHPNCPASLPFHCSEGIGVCVCVAGVSGSRAQLAVLAA